MLPQELERRFYPAANGGDSTVQRKADLEFLTTFCATTWNIELSTDRTELLEQLDQVGGGHSIWLLCGDDAPNRADCACVSVCNSEAKDTGRFVLVPVNSTTCNMLVCVLRWFAWEVQ
jgi:hypothetical protein